MAASIVGDKGRILPDELGILQLLFRVEEFVESSIVLLIG